MSATGTALRERAAARIGRVVDDPALARKLERAAWNATIEWCEARGVPACWDDPAVRWRYTHRVLGVEYNLKSNPELLRRVRTGAVPAFRDPRRDAKPCLLDMKPWEMSPEKWEAAFELAARRQLSRSEYNPDPDKVPDGAFRCGKCKSRKTSYYEIQTRAADEPMTVFIQCLMCKNRWKQ